MTIQKAIVTSFDGKEFELYRIYENGDIEIYAAQSHYGVHHHIIGMSFAEFKRWIENDFWYECIKWYMEEEDLFRFIECQDKALEAFNMRYYM